MVIEEAFLFSDDSAFVKFEDGSSLQLSSCGAVFRCSTDLNSVANKHVLNKRETQQFCQFTTTLWKERVKFSLGFRNKFAEIPYVCRHLLGMDVLEVLFMYVFFSIIIIKIITKQSGFAPGEASSHIKNCRLNSNNISYGYDNHDNNNNNKINNPLS